MMTRIYVGLIEMSLLLLNSLIYLKKNQLIFLPIKNLKQICIKIDTKLKTTTTSKT